MKKFLVIIPTYNEKDNIKHLIIDICNLLCNELDINILIVDDNSPDNTSGIVQKLMTDEFKNKLFLIKRDSKQGLGSAYTNGFKWGLKKGYDVFMQMDADYSHDPKYLIGLISAVEEYDFVIGSRYIDGGGIKGWGLLRKLISYGGSLYSRIILGIDIKDLTGGFNLWRREVLNTIDLDNILSDGYSFQIEMKYRAYKKGFKFVEYPIVFTDRTLGKSKMSKKIVLEAIKNVWKLRFLI